ncbi:hypothetical protein K438DRAFT_2167709 [Mycena galopus ATCC 62051]|nr:hypothetical protein K438DRAFT_2167709 [Mycena galopus ATCC 62051]
MAPRAFLEPWIPVTLLFVFCIYVSKIRGRFSERSEQMRARLSERSISNEVRVRTGTLFSVCDRIRSGDLFVGESFYIPLLYKDFKVHPDDLEDGLFQSELLVKFTSPSSSNGWEQDENLPPQKRAAKSSTSSLIEITDSSSGLSYGYVTTDYYMGYSTFDPTENLRTVSITIACNPNADDWVGLNVVSVSPWEWRDTLHMADIWSDHPNFGVIMSCYATDNDMSSATDKSASLISQLVYLLTLIHNYTWMGTTGFTTAVPSVVGNSPQDAQCAEQASESPVWTYDPTDGTLTLSWYNTDGSAGTTIPVKVGSILYATGNVEQLAARFNRPDVDIISGKDDHGSKPLDLEHNCYSDFNLPQCLTSITDVSTPASTCRVNSSVPFRTTKWWLYGTTQLGSHSTLHESVWWGKTEFFVAGYKRRESVE